MITQSSDIEFLKSFYAKYNFDGPTQVPDFSHYLHDKIKVIFNNERYHHTQITDLIKSFFDSMRSIKIHMVEEIKCLNPDDRSYLILSNWECETMQGKKGICPMLEIVTIEEDKIVDAVAMMDTTEIGKF